MNVSKGIKPICILSDITLEKMPKEINTEKLKTLLYNYFTIEELNNKLKDLGYSDGDIKVISDQFSKSELIFMGKYMLNPITLCNEGYSFKNILPGTDYSAYSSFNSMFDKVPAVIFKVDSSVKAGSNEEISFSITIKGKTYTTNPIQIIVE